MIKIAVASGKGGTGKTTAATNIALASAAQKLSVAYIDCDVEEPNGALFLKPDIDLEQDVEVSVPAVDPKKCVGCGKCGKICQFNAIAALGKNVMIFPELCHGCAGCWLACPSSAITESRRVAGKLQTGHAGDIKFIQGLLNIGEAMSPPVIRAVKKSIPTAELVIIDSPPGASCPVIESVRDADYVLLVTEPTPFGLNDLKLAVEMVKALELPFGVVINRANTGDDETQKFCRDFGIEIMAQIPDCRKVAEAYSRGEMAFNVIPEFRDMFAALLDKILATAGHDSDKTKRSAAK